MKPKGQQNFTSDLEAREKLIVYVYEYLIHSNAKQAAELFKENIGYNRDIKVNEGPGFLFDWWCVFWDLYCAAPERRHSQPESSSDARAFHDFMRSHPMSPSVAQSSPPQHPQQPQAHPQQQFMGGPRYGPPAGQIRGPPTRMQMPPQHAGHHPVGFVPAGSPRYAQHPVGPPPQPHMGQGGPMFVPEQMGPSPGMNRMTPVGGPPPPAQMVGMAPGQPQMVAAPGQGHPPALTQQQQQQQQQQHHHHQQQQQQQVNSMQGAGPLRNGSQVGAAGGWQGNMNYHVNSPANPQACYPGAGPNQPPNQVGAGGSAIMMNEVAMMDVKPVNGGAAVGPVGGAGVPAGEPSTPHPADEYQMPVQFSQESNDHCESAEILKIKQSMQEDTTKMFEKEQSEFSLADYSDSQGKWS